MVAPELGPCGSSGRLAALGVSALPGLEFGPLGAQPLPRVLALAASKVAGSTAFDLWPSRYGAERTDQLFREIEEVVVYSLLAVQKVMINDKHCFEMYGYDVMIDDNLKPWLIEVNSSPSITADTPTDYELKFGLLDDVWTIIDVEGKLGGAVEPVVGGFDLVYNNGPVKPDKSACYTTRLGCYEDRVRQLKKMHKHHAKRLAAGP